MLHYKKTKFTYKQDVRLRKLVNDFGTENWKFISQQMKHFTPKECKERYHLILNGAVIKRPWSNEEDRQLKALVESYGTKWTFFLIFFKDRTINDLKNRYYRFIRNKGRDSEPQMDRKISASTANPKNLDFTIQRFKIENLLV